MGVSGRPRDTGSDPMADLDLTELASARGGSGTLRGYLAAPAGDGPWPGVVVIHEIFGLDDVMRRHADRLASLGYLTLAVDLYSSGGAARCLVSTMRAMAEGHGRAFADIATARDYLLSAADCTGKIGVIGFCMGGGFALMTAGSGYQAAATNYGQLPRNPDAALPTPARSSVTTAAGTPHSKAPRAVSTRCSTKQASPTTSRSTPPRATRSSTTPKRVPDSSARSCASLASGPNPPVPQTHGAGSRTSLQSICTNAFSINNHLNFVRRTARPAKSSVSIQVTTGPQAGNEMISPDW
jgi:dienelactone hydrolase